MSTGAAPRQACARLTSFLTSSRFFSPFDPVWIVACGNVKCCRDLNKAGRSSDAGQDGKGSRRQVEMRQQSLERRNLALVARRNAIDQHLEQGGRGQDGGRVGFASTKALRASIGGLKLGRLERAANSPLQFQSVIAFSIARINCWGEKGLPRMCTPVGFFSISPKSA